MDGLLVSDRRLGGGGLVKGSRPLRAPSLMLPLWSLAATTQIALPQHMLLTVMFSLALIPKLRGQITKNWSNETKENFAPVGFSAILSVVGG